MFGTPVEDEFANNISKADAAARGISYWPILILINAGLVLLIIWAGFSEIESVTTGQGQVIPSSQLQVVQTLEGGIIRSISVQEGDLVKKGQELMQIDDTGFSSQLGEISRRKSALIAERARLLAEADFLKEINFPDSLKKNSPASIAAEMEVFNSRRLQLSGELEVLKNRLDQRRSELVELGATETKLATTLVPLQREAELTQEMFSKGVIPEIELLRLQGRLAELQGDLSVVIAAKPKLEAAIREAANKISSTRNAYILTARERLARVSGELAIIEETMRAAKDRVTRTLLRAPVNGIINKINATTIGSVVQPGRDIMEIVPIDDGLLIEARIRPQDVAFIKPDEQASVKLTAYDYLIYGALKGKVVRISADTISDNKGENFYRVIIRTDKNYLGDNKNILRIIPGMVATVDIQAGTNTVLSYLLKPILRARSEAFRER